MDAISRPWGVYGTRQNSASSAGVKRPYGLAGSVGNTSSGNLEERGKPKDAMVRTMVNSRKAKRNYAPSQNRAPGESDHAMGKIGLRSKGKIGRGGRVD